MLSVVLLTMSLAACGSSNKEPGNGAGEAAAEYADDVAVTDLRDAVAQVLGDNYWPNMDIPADYLETNCGVSPDLYDEFVAQMPMISVNVDSMILVKAKEGQTENLRNALDSYRKYLADEALQYPGNIGKVQAAMVDSYGRYVCFVMLGGDTAQAAEQGDEAVIKHCQEANQKALDTIREKLVK